MNSDLTPQQKLDKAYKRLRGTAAGVFPIVDQRDARRLESALESFFIHYERLKSE